MAYIRNTNNAYDNLIKPNIELISAWYRDGHSKKWIAQKLGITDRCLLKWIRQVPELDEVFQRSKEQTDLVDVVNAYLKSAKGYYVTEWTRQYLYDEDGNRRLVNEYEKVRFIQPDVKAQEHWIRHRLKNYEGWEDFSESLDKKIEEEQTVDSQGIILIPERSVLVEVDGQYSEQQDHDSPETSYNGATPTPVDANAQLHAGGLK